MTRKGLYLTIALFLLAGHRASGQEHILHSVTVLSDSACGYLFGLGYELAGDPSAEPAGYYTLRLFIENCPFWKEANGANSSAAAFNFINSAISEWTTGGAGRWPDYLAFLKQVLYLNPDTAWYCEDVGDMITAVQNDVTSQMAIAQYVLESGKCPGWDFETLYNSASIGRHWLWLDTIQRRYQNSKFMSDSINADTLRNPYDSTIPTLQQLDLQILLGPQNAVQGASTPITPNDTCGVSYAKAKQKGVKPQSKLDTIPHDCNYSFNLGDALNGEGKYVASYDTLKGFVERCPTNSYAPGAFGIMETDVGGGGDGPFPQCLQDFQKWLLSALAWNPGNAEYFCSDVQALAGTFGTTDDTSWAAGNTVQNDGLSVIYWINHNPLCANSYDNGYYIGSRGSQRGTWIDWPGMDTSKTHLDTTIYSMHDLGLDSVLKYAGLLGVNNANNASIISNASASPNPVSNGTEIFFNTSREAYVKIDLFNLLGVKVGAAGFKSVVQPGNHEVPVSLSGLPSGTYYVRIVTTYGEVQTVKLVKE